MFSDLQMKVCSESALQAIYPELVKLNDFCHTYSDLEDRKGAAIVIPTFDLSAAGDFVAGTNQYDSGEQEADATTLTLNKHLVKSIEYTDRDVVETEVNWIRDAGAGIASVIGRGLNKYVMNMFNSANIELSAEINLGTKTQAAQLYKIAAENGLDVADSVVVLTPENFSKVLGLLDVMTYGGPEALRYGYVPGLFGFKSVVCSTYLPEGVDGVIVNRNSVGIASRYLAPMAGAYPDAWKTTDPSTGFTVGWRSFCALGSGKRYLAGECICGARIFWGGKKAVRLSNAS